MWQGPCQQPVVLLERTRGRGLPFAQVVLRALTSLRWPRPPALIVGLVLTPCPVQRVARVAGSGHSSRSLAVLYASCVLQAITAPPLGLRDMRRFSALPGRTRQRERHTALTVLQAHTRLELPGLAQAAR